MRAIDTLVEEFACFDVQAIGARSGMIDHVPVEAVFGNGNGVAEVTIPVVEDVVTVL